MSAVWRLLQGCRARSSRHLYFHCDVLPFHKEVCDDLSPIRNCPDDSGSCRRRSSEGRGVCVTGRSLSLPGGAVLRAATVNLRKVLAWVVFALVVVYVVKFPDHTAAFLRNAGTGLGDAVSSLASFVGSMF